jgi:streptogramin lyase
MTFKRALYAGVAAVAIAAFVTGMPAMLPAQQPPAAVQIGSEDIGGGVTGPNGPEAGVWVIAETSDLPTTFARIVVTDDQGRYRIPALPKANYKVWVRGYGLVDSPKVHGVPGKTLNLTAVPAPNEAAAAHYYPAIYWYSMLKIPPASEFGGKGDIPAGITQERWLTIVKNQSCVGCHQMGLESTRKFPAAFSDLKTHEEAWIRRVPSGQAARLMVTPLAGVLGGVPFRYYADWTERIEKGELPHAKPPRPQGVERNIVVTWWEWFEPEKYLHDLIASDRRFPTVNAYGPLYGSAEYASDIIPILDPKTHTVTYYTPPVRPGTPEALGKGHAADAEPMQPSAYWGDRKIWDSKVNNHNAMFDRDGRVWFAATFMGPDNPAFCKKGSDHPSAKVFPLERTNRRLTVLEPKTMKYTFVETCFGSHHLQFDAKDRLWTSGTGQVAGWLDTRMFLETGDAAKSQGWSPFVLDINGNGKRDEFVGPKDPVDSAKDKRIDVGSGPYAVMPNPADGSIWYTIGVFAGRPGVLRFDPETQLSEIYYVARPGFGIRGGDIDKKGVVWVSTASGHLASFDRSKCKGPLNGPKATGDHCPEGWAFHQYPGPGFQGIGENSAESSYYTWVDQHNTFGLGEDVPMSTANLYNGLVALNRDGQMVRLQVPYPMGFYAKGFDGRIDDPNAGWKGRGLWTSSGDRAPWLMEGGKGRRPLAVQFQLRPDPLAR